MIKKTIERSQRLIKKMLGVKYQPTMIEKCASFVACEKLYGSYYEFGTYQGDSFIDAFKALSSKIISRANHDTYLGYPAEYLDRIKIWDEMKFYAFDSFEGLPELADTDVGTHDFKAGQYQYDEDSFKNRVSKNGVDLCKVVTVPGWFSDTCSEESSALLDLDKAVIIWIDCDLYSSASDVMRLVNRIIQDGTILIFDDWFTHRGHPERGVQKAFYEWSGAALIQEHWQINEYTTENWARKAFIVNRRE